MTGALRTLLGLRALGIEVPRAARPRMIGLLLRHPSPYPRTVRRA